MKTLIILLFLIFLVGCNGNLNKNSSIERPNQDAREVINEAKFWPYEAPISVNDCENLDDKEMIVRTADENITKRSKCLMRFALMEDNVGICNSISEANGVNFCRNIIAGDRVMPHRKTKEEWQDQFISEEAIYSQNASQCNNIKDEEIKEKCKGEIFVTTKNIEGCEELNLERQRNFCFSRITKKYGINLCDKIKDNEWKKECESFLEDIKIVNGIGTRNLFQGDKDNAPDYIKTFARNFWNPIWWGTDFEILDIEYDFIMGKGHTKIKLKDNTIKEIDLGYGDLCLDAKNTRWQTVCCNNDFVGCKVDFTWGVQINNQEGSYWLYCPITLDICRELNEKAKE